MTTQSEGGNELSQMIQSVRGVCVEVVPYVQPKLSRAFHAHRGKTFLHDLQTWTNRQ